jgi:hypothetical protein
MGFDALLFTSTTGAKSVFIQSIFSSFPMIFDDIAIYVGIY